MRERNVFSDLLTKVKVALETFVGVSLSSLFLPRQRIIN